MARVRDRLRMAYQALTTRDLGGVRPRASTYHEAAGKSRRLQNWTGTTADISTIASMSGDMMLKRARQLVTADAYAANAKEEFAAALVGTGIRPSCTLEDREQRETVQRLWADWVDEAESEGQMSLYGVQDVAAGALFDAGELFIRFRARRPSDGLTVPLQLQLLEAEFLDRTYNMGLANGHQIKAGIEFDLIGRRAAYHFWKSHPGDQLSVMSSGERVRVPADQVLHVYQVTRPGQIRGLPAIVPGMIRLHLLSSYDDAELDRKRVASLLAGFIISPEEYGEDNQFTNEEPDDEEGTATAEWAPATLLTLRPGEDVKFSEPADVGSNYETFEYRNLLAIAAALGVPYSSMTGDVKQANYSSLRADMVRLRRRTQRTQNKTLIYQFCRPVWQRFVSAAVLSGAVTTDVRVLQRAVTWIPPKWDWVDPLKDRQAEKLAVEMGTKPRSAVIIEEGRDPEETDRQIAEDQARAERLGLRLGVGAYTFTTGASSAQVATEDDDQEDDQDRDKSEEQQSEERAAS